MNDIGIGRLAEAAGVKIPTIRFYEQIGLLPKPTRSAGKQRRYSQQAITRLRFIRHARNLGFDVEDIRHLLKLAEAPDAPCKTVDGIARHQVARIDAKMKQLRAMRRELMTVITGCRAERIRDCRILESLSEPSVEK